MHPPAELPASRLYSAQWRGSVPGSNPTPRGSTCARPTRGSTRRSPRRGRWSPTAMPIMRAAATARCWRRPRRWRSWRRATGRRPGQPIAYGETIRVGEVDVRFVPAGHVLGSAQIVLEHKGERVVVSGDYKRRPDPTCAPFEPVPCDIFVTEATFGLPVFRHPDTGSEIDRLLHRAARQSRALRAGRRLCARQGAADDHRAARRAGMTSRSISTARSSGCASSTQSSASTLGELRPATGATKAEMAGPYRDRARPARSTTAGRGACPIRSRRWRRAGCGSASAPASAMSSCR